MTRLLELGSDQLDTVRRWAMTGGDLLGGMMDRQGMLGLPARRRRDFLRFG